MNIRALLRLAKRDEEGDEKAQDFLDVGERKPLTSRQYNKRKTRIKMQKRSRKRNK